MYRAVRRKFELHPELKAHAACDRRRRTLPKPTRPTAIGASAATAPGLNKLGKIMTRIRDELRAAAN